MNFRFIAMALTVLMTLFPGSSKGAVVPEVELLKTSYQQKVISEVDTPHNTALEKLTSNYLLALNRAMIAAQTAGELNDSLALKAEIDRLTVVNPAPVNNEKLEIPSELKRFQSVYLSEVTKLEAEKRRKLRILTSDYARALPPLIAEYTRAGKLEEAKSIQNELDEAEKIKSGDDALNIVGKWSIEQDNNIEAEWTFNADYTYNYFNNTGKFTFKEGTYFLTHTWDWELRMTNENRFTGKSTRGGVGVKVIGKRIQ